MTAILDTGPLVAYAHRGDAAYERSRRLMRRVLAGAYGTVISLDLVLLEGLTLIRSRVRDRAVAETFAAFFHGAEDLRGPILRMRPSGDLIERAVEIHFRHYDRGLSSVDAALVALTDLTNGVLVTFDRGFQGIVPTLHD